MAQGLGRIYLLLIRVIVVTNSAYCALTVIPSKKSSSSRRSARGPLMGRRVEKLFKGDVRARARAITRAAWRIGSPGRMPLPVDYRLGVLPTGCKLLAGRRRSIALPGELAHGDTRESPNLAR